MCENGLHMYVCMSVCNVCEQTCMCMRFFVLCVCVYVCMYVCMYVRMHVCMCVSTYVCVCVYAYISFMMQC